VRVRGPILQLPDDPHYIGTWLVGPQRVEVAADTEIDQSAGPVGLGVWVEVVGTQTNHDPVQAQSIKVLARAEGTPRVTRTPEPGRTPRPTMTPMPHGIEFEGLIESRPQTPNGLWRIAGRDVMVTSQTEIEEDRGRAVVGATVKVEGWQSNSGPIVAREIKVIVPAPTS
jgi:hypothetical protein